ncbi:acetylglutamate synthase [Trichoderma cornu-damae]|uniref:Amino-acid acetyltransferase, mitochondrial n=1 Tax=Trichoderma cornu-damae TaxID=654480 RepID=A0A9P8QKB4_9HYPO|nr:acetylglutamate synthase [Trichoderma cornu-damae]
MDLHFSPLLPLLPLAASLRPQSPERSDKSLIGSPLTLYQDVIVSVLESSATRRDAKSYLQKYAPPNPASQQGTSKQTEHQHRPHPRPLRAQRPFNVAVVVLRNPQRLRPDIMRGIAKTLTQLRALGLTSAVVVDCGTEESESRSAFQHEALRLCEAVDSFGKPGARLIENLLVGTSHYRGATPSPFWDDIYVQDYGILDRALQHNMIAVIPSLARNDETTTPAPADAQRAALALTRYFTGMQFEQDLGRSRDGSLGEGIGPLASVERVIILDPFGGTPVPGRSGVRQRFINLEQEYDTLLGHLGNCQSSPEAANSGAKEANTAHARNLKLARDTLSLLPETASVLITTPFAAANTSTVSSGLPPARSGDYQFCFDGMVTTRKKQNPLLHNLLTDKPVFSPSLPLQRIQSPGLARLDTEESIDATLVKRGMPLVIYPDPRAAPWRPPAPGERRLQLTDKCIDLPRLATLLGDSFGRKLDLDDYLRRTKDNLAGLIIAGEYEGCAILTWEKPKNVDPRTAYEEGRFVPYLDKFAVLRSRQGSGGVADIVFNAMVRDCFPDGVLWRSRKDNPVNKWYFERSVGTRKLADCNWAMFWTTLELGSEGQRLNDYEAVAQ